MANITKSVPENVPGDFFVDSTCIDCDACRQIAPTVFAEAAETSYVKTQPQSPEDRKEAAYALLSCPTGSIGCQAEDDLKTRMADFPLPLEEPVYYCGFNSPKSFGGNSYFVKHPEGNWMIDSPKFQKTLVRRLEELGGVDHIFLTHRDDVAEADKFARHFGAERMIDRRELDSQPGSEMVLEGDEPTRLAEDFLAIPTPGHTEGHCCLLFRDRFLFTGDHLSWSRHKKQLRASRSHCWYSWELQKTSMNWLTKHQFEWVLPGHGQRVHLPAKRMANELRELVERM